jgi:hypothetical protein
MRIGAIVAAVHRSQPRVARVANLHTRTAAADRAVPSGTVTGQDTREVASGTPAGRGGNWYRGDCHVHSSASNGAVLTPAQLAVAARRGGLDFIAATEHNTVDTYDAWQEESGTGLLVIPGQEVVTQDGHWLALGLQRGHLVDWRHGRHERLIDRELARVREGGGIAVAAHPYAPYATGELRYPFAAFDAMEAWNGLWTSDMPWNADNGAAVRAWEASLTRGQRAERWTPVIGNSDAHLDGQLGLPHTVVLADALSTGSVLAAVRAGRCWVAGSMAIDVSLTVSAGGRAAGIGERLATNGSVCNVRLQVDGAASASVAIRTPRGVVHREAVPAEGSAVIHWDTDSAASRFVRVEIRDSHGQMLALTNPVFLD